MPAPEENHRQLFEHLLIRNQKLVGAAFSIGDEDAVFLKGAIPRSGLWICRRTGHAINLEEPALFNAAMQDFIHAVQQGGWGERDPRSLSSHLLRPICTDSD